MSKKYKGLEGLEEKGREEINQHLLYFINVGKFPVHKIWIYPDQLGILADPQGERN